MKLLRRLFRPHVELAPELRRRVLAWRARAAADERRALGETRFVAVDVETTGLDPRRDRLLAIGATAVEDGRLVPGAGLSEVLRNEAGSTRENILIHGLGPDAQARGAPRELALMAFLEFAGKDPLVAFHAAFDRAVLDRAARETLGVRTLNPWLDLASLAPALFPEARLRQAGLDEWLGYFGLRAHARHRALYDAAAAGELFLILLARARARGIGTLGALLAAAEHQARRMLGSGVGGA